MKAIQLHGYGQAQDLKYEDAPMPEVGAGQVRVRVHAASVNPLDYKKASGAMKQMMPLTFPWTPGMDLSGVVDEVAPDVTAFKVGDAVYGGTMQGGAAAQYVVADAGALSLKPDVLSHAEAAAVMLVGQTAWQALFDTADVQAGQTVLIHGASGAVGSVAVQLARWKGAKVIATASPVNAEYLRGLGADEVLDSRSDFPQGLSGVDMVLDNVGGSQQVKLLGVLKPGGILVALPQPPSAAEAAQHQVRAVMGGTDPNTETRARLEALITSGDLKPEIAQTFPLSQLAQAWEKVAGGVRGKVVVEPELD